MKGNVTITAGQTASVSASDIIAGKDTLITGRNVDIESKDNIYRGKEEHEYKKSGLTVSLGGAVITAKDNIIRPIKNAGQAHDGLLGKLYAADAGFNLHDAVKTYKNIGDVKKGITLDVSLGTQSAKSDSRYQGTEAKESRIVSKGNVRIKSDENIAVKGSQITGENVTLQAGKDIHLTAAENRKTAEGNSRSKGAGITASFGIGGLQNVGISAGKSKGNMEEEIMTHTGSAVTAKNTLTMESGKDIDIKGSKAGGKKVEIKTGNNLSIESLQDSHAYHSRDKESGIHLQRDRITRPDTGKKKMDDPYFSIGKKTDTTDSTYTSVTKQAGIYAGKEGYDIQVKNNTHLKGAVIDSKAPAEKNKLTTGTLTWENIENKAEYKTGGHGISYNGKIGGGDKNDPLDSRTNNRYGKDTITGQRNGMNKITETIYGSKIPLNERGILNTPIPSVKGKAGTTTRSAVAKGTITITDKENQKQDIEKLNRNTEDSLNKLKEIFDKTKVEEKQELIHMMNIVGNQIIHEAADHYGWKEGSTEKLLLHGAIGALTGTMSGGNALSGAVSGSVNEFALAYMEKTKGRDWMDTHPDTVQAISTALGAVAGSLTGDRNTGAYTAQMGTRWNRLAKKPQEDLNKQLKQELSTEKKNPDELLKLLTEYINMSEAAEHPASQKALHGIWNEEKGYTLPKMTISAQEYKAIDQKSFNRVAQKYNLPTKWNNKKNVQENLESLRYDLERKTYKGRTVFQSDWAKYGGYGLDFIGELQIGNVSGLARGIGTIGDFGNYVTAEDRNKVLSEIAGGYAGSALGNKLMPIIITGMGLEQINPMGTHAVKALGISGMSLVEAFILEEAYIQKKTYLDYIYHINKYNYDQEQFDSELIQNFDIKE